MSVITASPAGVRVRLEGVCHDCKHRHRYDVAPHQFAAHAGQWEAKHRGHDFELLSPSRLLPRGLDDRAYEQAGRAPWWLDYRHNADIKVAYASSATLTIDLSSLASSSSFTAGRESTAVSNTTNKYLDYLLAGVVRTGTTPTASREIRAYLYGSVNDTPTYPDVLDGTDSAETVTSENVLGAAMALWGGAVIDSTSDRDYWFRAAGIAAFFNHLLPKNWGLFVAHNTAVALNATAGNHVWTQTGLYATSV